MPDVEQTVVKATFNGIWSHKASGQSNCPAYGVNDDVAYSGRIEEGDLLFRYILGDDSTTDGDPKAAFRLLDGMAGDIRVTWAGVATTSVSPKMTSSEGINATQACSTIVAGLAQTCYTGEDSVPKGTLIALKQERAEVSTPVRVPRAGKQIAYPIHIMKMVPPTIAPTTIRLQKTWWWSCATAFGRCTTVPPVAVAIRACRH
jgi:hypothetical protein